MKIYLKLTPIALLVAMYLWATLVHAASFDCEKAATKIEKLICTDPELSKLDERVAHAYKRALARSQGSEVTKAEQIRWLKKRNACHEDVACLKSAHKARIVEVTRDEYENPSGWWMREGVGGGFCDALHRQLAPYRREDTSACPAGMALSLPGMKDASGWREINPLAHVDLINKARLFKAINHSDSYFEIWVEGDSGVREHARVQQIKAQIEPYTYTPDVIEKMVAQEGLRLRVKDLSIIRYGGALGYGNKVERQTLLEIRTSSGPPVVDAWSSFSGEGERRGSCPLPQKDRGSVHSFFVTEDLSDLDVAMRGTEITYDQLVDYKGQLYFMHNVSSFGTLFRESYTTGTLLPFCSIEWHGKNRWPELNPTQSQNHQN